MKIVGSFCLLLVAFVGIGKSFPALSDNEIENVDVIDLSMFRKLIFKKNGESVRKAVNEWQPSDYQNPEELGTFFQGDIVLPTNEGKNGLVDKSRRWTNGVVPYVFAASVSQTDRNLIQKAISEYHSNTCIRFHPRKDEQDYLSFENNEAGCFSQIGRAGGKQKINLQSPGCDTKVGTPIHEIMHTLGVFHEQARDDRDSFVRINFQNIIPNERVQFDKLPAGTTSTYGVAYDIGSVLHYSPYAFSSNNRKTIEVLRGDDKKMGQRDGFARGDLLKINLMYKCENSEALPEPTKPTNGFRNPLETIINALGNIFGG